MDRTRASVLSKRVRGDHSQQRHAGVSIGTRIRWWGALTCLDLVAKPSPAPEARGGGADRVGPPTGWHRLRQIGDELVPGVEQFLLVDNVVAVEDGAALVAGQEHGDPLGDVCADQVARGGTAAVVKETGRHPGRLAGRAPRRAPAADGDAVAVEDQWAVRLTACPSPRQGLGNGL